MWRKPDVVRLGEYDLEKDSDTDESIHFDFTAKQIIKHPLYKPPSAYHDLALIQLNETIHPYMVSKY